MSKLTLSPEVKRQVDEILAPLKNPDDWKKLELSFAPNPFAIVRIDGASGTGKTVLAKYMARRLEQPPLYLDFENVANDTLGGTERAIIEVFHKADETETKTIILEECEAILWSRAKVTEDTLHQLGFVDTLLKCIDKFKSRSIPSLLILNTNYPELLDNAMVSRITDVINLFPPVGRQAVAMWYSKLPQSIKYMTEAGYQKLADTKATPRQMETAILKVCRKSMFEKRQPEFSDFELP